MIWFIIALILLLVAGLAITVGALTHKPAADEYDPRRRRSSDGEVPRGAFFTTGAVLALAAGVILLFDSSTIVQTRSVGVQVSFGKPVASLRNGWHWVAPWSTVEKFDASVQTLKLSQGAKGNDADKSTQPCATVRLGNQTTACVDATVQWNIDPNGDVIDLYRRYRTFDNIEANLIERQLQHALNVVFEPYDPLRAVTGSTDSPSDSLDDLARKALSVLQSSVGAGVKVDNITLPLVHYDNTTQDKLNAFAQSLADTRIAQQRKVTAQLIADANTSLAGSAATKDPGVQYQNCLDLIRYLAEHDQLGKLPQAFTCGTGGQTPVIIGAK